MLVGLLKQFKDSECKDVAVLTEQVHALIRAACTAGAAPDPTLLAAFHRFLPPLYQAQRARDRDGGDGGGGGGGGYGAQQ